MPLLERAIQHPWPPMSPIISMRMVGDITHTRKDVRVRKCHVKEHKLTLSSRLRVSQ